MTTDITPAGDALCSLAWEIEQLAEHVSINAIDRNLVRRFVETAYAEPNGLESMVKPIDQLAEAVRVIAGSLHYA